MRRIIARDEPLIREVWTRAQLIERWTKQGETFKAEWAAELPDDEELTVYKAGKGGDAWLDMCRGPHLASTGRSAEHTSELQSLMRISSDVLCLKNKNVRYNNISPRDTKK